jgi:hypothetical protein
MSLEWARARLLQHCEALRKLCEAQAATRAQQRPVTRPKRPSAALVTLRPYPAQRPLTDVARSGKVLQFAPPGRRRRA